MGIYYFCWRKSIQCHCVYQWLSIVLRTFGVMAAGRGVGLGSDCLSVGMLGLPCVSASMHGRTVNGVRVCNLHRRLNSVVYFTHTAYIASTKAIIAIASIMTNNQNVLENVGGVNANY